MDNIAVTESEQAFPRSVNNDGIPAYPGMTLRDYFAGQALSGHCTYEMLENALNIKEPHESVGDAIAKQCYVMADAMLKARKEAPGE